MSEIVKEINDNVATMTVVKNIKKVTKVELGNINPANLKQLQTINISTLPVRYTDKFYKDLLINYPQELLQFAFWNGFSVGAVCARIESHETEEGCNKLYIMIINVLAAYRRRGIASLLLSHVLNEASKNPTIIEVYLHVQTSNQDAKEFYLANGFIETDIIYGYYRNIEPPDCYVLKKSLKEGHEVMHASTTDQQQAIKHHGDSNDKNNDHQMNFIDDDDDDDRKEKVQSSGDTNINQQ